MDDLKRKQNKNIAKKKYEHFNKNSPMVKKTIQLNFSNRIINHITVWENTNFEFVRIDSQLSISSET